MRERRSGERKETKNDAKKNVSHSNDGAVVGWEILFTAMQNLSDEKKKIIWRRCAGEDCALEGLVAKQDEGELPCI